MSLLIVSASDVARIAATFEPQELTDLMAQVFYGLSSRERTEAPVAGIYQPHRISVPLTNHTALFMPSRIEPFGTAIKVVSVPTSTAPHAVKASGLPGTTIVLDEMSGSVKTIVNARQLTALRNAAGSLLATRLLLHPNAQPRTLVAFGAGAQITAHISLFLKYYSTITSCTIFNRSVNARLFSLISSLKAENGAVDIKAGVLQKEAVQDADLIITATPSTTPLFPSEYVKSGAHICLIGSYKPDMHEVHADLIKRAGKVIVDSRAACLVEAGELIAAEYGPTDLVEIGELLQLAISPEGATWTPRTEVLHDIQDFGDVTIFKSVGVGVQDVAIASAVAAKAEQENIGTRIIGYDELS